MNREDIYNLTEKAFVTNHIQDLLSGNGEWKVAVGRKDVADFYTDLDRIVRLGIIPYCKNNEERIVQFREEYIKFIESGYKNIAIAFDCYFFYCYKIRSVEEDFLFGEQLRKKLANAIINQKDELSKITEWCGYAYPKGYYSSIISLNSMLMKKFGMGLL